MQIEPFRIAVSDAVLADLRERLARTRFPDEIADSGWTYGTDLAYLKELVAYWRDRYDWRAAEARSAGHDAWLAGLGGGVPRDHRPANRPRCARRRSRRRVRPRVPVDARI